MLKMTPGYNTNTWTIKIHGKSEEHNQDIFYCLMKSTSNTPSLVPTAFIQKTQFQTHLASRGHCCLVEVCTSLQITQTHNCLLSKVYTSSGTLHTTVGRKEYLNTQSAGQYKLFSWIQTFPTGTCKSSQSSDQKSTGVLTEAKPSGVPPLNGKCTSFR